jgi:hypothetical protein
VSPDEMLLVLTSYRPGGHGSGDLYVSHRSPDGAWSSPRNLGPAINTADLDYCPMATPDGRILFFSRRIGDTWDTATGGTVYWVDAAVLAQRDAPSSR